MDEQHFLVEVIARQRNYYKVQATDPQTAERIAGERWRRGESSDIGGVDKSSVVAIEAKATQEPLQAEQDEELLIRFIRERERLLTRLGGRVSDPSLSDAISAQQAATDLGWFRSIRPGESTVDTLRAAYALERLCNGGELVSFERARVRNGERAPTRLYCTPQYLERLSSPLTSRLAAQGR